MSKRKREIKKRKRQLGEADREEQSAAVEPGEGAARKVGDPVPEDTRAWESDVVDDMIPSTPPQSAYQKPAERKRSPARPSLVKGSSPSWFGRNRENLLLAVLMLYVLLLGLGTMGELFEVEWILNLPLFK